jgi:HD-GYP domain-containing protein (c-di-GMP phosphodiesterase class II)
VSTAAAPPFTSAPDPVHDELVRDARARSNRARLEHVRRRAYALTGSIVLVAAAVAALTIHSSSTPSPGTTATFVLTFALLTRVRFETGNGFSPPTELALVPMLFVLPLGWVPAAVAVGFVSGRGFHAVRRKDPARLLAQLSNAAHSFGPVLVLATLGGLPLRWSAWPIYVFALATQFAFDFGAAVLANLGSSVRPRTLLEISALPYAIDAALAPIGLCIAFATREHPELVVLVLPLVLLLRHFSQERKRRIDHALELSDAYRGTAFLLGDFVEADDEYTGNHSRHVVDLVLAVSDDIGLEPADRRVAEFVALLHDVGKIKIPNEIIVKPGPLTDDERAIIETHTIEGERLLEQVGGLLGHVGRVVRSCHEHWDGRGYPDGMAGEEIPLVARIVSACDAFSAMTTDRPYRAARTEAAALAEMRHCAGTQFDPRVVDALCRTVG